MSVTKPGTPATGTVFASQLNRHNLARLIFMCNTGARTTVLPQCLDLLSSTQIPQVASQPLFFRCNFQLLKMPPTTEQAVPATWWAPRITKHWLLCAACRFLPPSPFCHENFTTWADLTALSVLQWTALPALPGGNAPVMEEDRNEYVLTPQLLQMTAWQIKLEMWQLKFIC